MDMEEGNLISAGSRTLAIVSRGASLADAEATCESVFANIRGPYFHRSDIGTAALISRRVEHMNALRADSAQIATARHA
jgi:phosphoribosylamine-glycine ligase